MRPFEVNELASADQEKQWQRYVHSCPNASLYHKLEWRDIVVRTFGHRSRYLMAVQNRAVTGVLPLVEMQSHLFGHSMVSLPFVNYGGIVADTPECEAALAAAAIDIASRAGTRYVELRQPFAAASWAEQKWKVRRHKAALVICLEAEPCAMWTSLSSRLRGKVRKAEKSGAVFCTGLAELLKDFYQVFALNMRDLGTPVHSLIFFENILRYANNATVLLVRREKRPVAAAIALRDHDRIELPWICSDYSQTSYYVNEFLYWRAIEWAYRSSARELDLGRSSIGAGTYRFKMQWNPDVRPLSWYYWLPPGRKLPKFNPSNGKFALAAYCWKKLPLGMANRLGPRIIRNIP
jgi:serine/alanine adding enzyme